MLTWLISANLALVCHFFTSLLQSFIVIFQIKKENFTWKNKKHSNCEYTIWYRANLKEWQFIYSIYDTNPDRKYLFIKSEGNDVTALPNEWEIWNDYYEYSIGIMRVGIMKWHHES